MGFKSGSTKLDINCYIATLETSTVNVSSKKVDLVPDHFVTYVHFVSLDSRKTCAKTVPQKMIQL